MTAQAETEWERNRDRDLPNCGNKSPGFASYPRGGNPEIANLHPPMRIHVPNDWALPESEATPEPLWQLSHRRDFLKTLGLGVAGVALGRTSLLGATAGLSRTNPTRLSPPSSPPPRKTSPATTIFTSSAPTRPSPRRWPTRVGKPTRGRSKTLGRLDPQPAQNSGGR